VFSVDHDHVILQFVNSNTVLAGLDVSEITNVSDLISGSGMGLTKGVEMGASGNATIGQVSELMNVEAVESSGEAFNPGTDLDLLTFGLNEFDDSSDCGVSLDDASGVVSCSAIHFLKDMICNYKRF
jgi:hypothetical protein